MRGIRIAAAVAFVSLFALATAPAEAETKSWKAAKAVAPDNPAIVAQEDDAKEGIDAVKAGCGIDVLTVVTDVTVVLADPDVDDDDGIIVIGLNGVNEAKAVACLKKIAKKEKKVLTAKKVGKLVELSIKGERDKIYMAWLAKDVVAFAVEPDEKARLAKWIGGKGITGDVAATLTKVDTATAAWVAIAKQTELGPGANMKSAYGTVKLEAGNIVGEVNVVTGSAAEAKKAADEAKKELAKGASQLPPEIAKLVKAIAITTAGDVVTVKASIAETEVMSLVGLLMQM